MRKGILVGSPEHLEWLRNYFQRMRERKARGRQRGYHLMLREPGEERGRTIAYGSLDDLREQARDLAESGEVPEGSLLYVTVNRYGGTYGGGIYEGYEVVGGELVKGYKKYPRRVARGRFIEEGWGNSRLRSLVYRLGGSREDLRELTEELEEW